MATKDESKSLINISNVALPLLSKENRTQFKMVNDSIYSAQFYETGIINFQSIKYADTSMTGNTSPIFSSLKKTNNFNF